MNWKPLWTALGAVCLVVGMAQAQDSAHELIIKSDNDAYLANGSDRYYTNGFFVRYRTAKHRRELPNNEVKRIREMELGQKMYTSHSGYVWERSRVDRSITAYLYVGVSQTRHFKNESSLKLGLQLGTIGPNALGRQTQEIFHKITNTYAPNCWQYQLNNEIGLNSSVAYQDLVFRNRSQWIDFAWNSYLNLGNTFTGAGIGGSLRIGKMNRLFESSSNHSLIDQREKDHSAEQAELFLFTKPQLEWVAYDASISGGLFRKEKGPIVFKPERMLISQELGLNYSKKRFSLQFSYILKSREVKNAEDPQRYGSLSTAFRF